MSMTVVKPSKGSAQETDLYKVLGIERAASMDEIKAAYKRAAMKAHPDRGGCEELFKLVQLAFTVLSDPDKRKRYDDTGFIDDGVNSKIKIAEDTLAKMMLAAINDLDVERVDLVKMMAKDANRVAGELRTQMENVKKSKAKREKALDRIARKSGGENILINAIRFDIKNHETAIERLKEGLEMNKLITTLLEDYQYRVDPTPEVPEAVRYFIYGSPIGGGGSEWPLP